MNVFVTRLGGGKFRCTYIPVVPGAYLLHITWNGRQLRGSPYKVKPGGAVKCMSAVLEFSALGCLRIANSPSLRTGPKSARMFVNCSTVQGTVKPVITGRH